MTTKLMTIAAAFAAFALAPSLYAGNTCTWQGGSGKFSETAKWDTVPVSGNGDTIRFDTTDGVAITVENDLVDDFSVSNVVFATKDIDTGDCGKVTLTGSRLYISGGKDNDTVVWDHGGATLKDRGPVVDVDLPLRIKTGRVNFSRNVTFKRKVTIDDSGYVALRWPGSLQYKNNYPIVTFEDEVVGVQATLDNSAGKGGDGSSVYYRCKVTLNAFNVCAKSLGKLKPYLQASENDISTIWVRYAYLYMDGSPCLGTNTVVTRADDNNGNSATYIRGADVVCDRLVGSDSSRHQTVCDDNQSGKLTMRASADGSSGFKFTQKVSLVYDPQGNYTYTLTDSDSATTGSLEIKGGTFKLKNSTAFSALSEVIVRSGAVLDLSESTAATPFAATARLTVDDGGSIVLPAGKNVTFSSGTYRGIPLAAGDYSTGWVSGGTVTLSTSSQAADTRYWANPVSGDWNIAANWTPEGVPSATETAVIGVRGASGYTVRMAGGETKPAKIVVGTDLTAAATLSIAGEAAFTKDTLIEVNRGGEIAVPAGGRFVYDMEGAAKHAELIRIADGRFVVHGGYAMVTNTYGVIVASGAEGEILVSGGELVLADKNDGSNYGLSLKEGATLRMTGGAISIPARWYNSYLYQAVDGVCDFSGGTLFLNRVAQPNQFRFSGDVAFSGSAVWTNGSDEVRVIIAPRAGAQSMTFSLSDNATMAGTTPGFVFIGAMGETTFRMDSTGTVMGMQCNVGIAKGTALYRQTAGYSLFTWRGLCAGMTRPRNPSDGMDEVSNAVTGIVEVAGGAVCVSGETAGHDSWGNRTDGMFPPGTVLGYGGTTAPPASGRPYVGRMTISGTGSLTNRYGHLLVGVAPYGEGSLVLDGGTLRSTCERYSGHNDYREIIACAVGVGGGKGEFLVRGGECSISNNVWIGGVATNALRVTGATQIKAYPYDTHGGEGLLEVSGGRVAFGRNLVVGAEGTGVVSVVGSSASLFSVGRDLVLTNEAAFVAGGAETATLRFKADANGVTPIAVAGKLVVTPQAKLEVDLTDFDIRTAEYLPLLTCASKEGDFGAGQITLTGDQAATADVIVSETGIKVAYRRGTVISFR